MCDPITIAGVALTAGSTVANNMAANKVQKARDSALAAEQIRQGGLDQQAAALNTQSRERYDDIEGKQGQRSEDLGDYFAGQNIAQGSANAQATADMNAAALPAGASNITVQEENKQLQKARSFTEAQGKALGNLRAFGDVLGEIGRGQARDAGQVGQIGGFKQGFANNVLPYQLETAGKAGDSLKLFGDLLGLGGSVGLSAGLGGAKLPSVEALSGLFDPSVAVSGRGVVPAAGPASFSKSGSLVRLYPG